MMMLFVQVKIDEMEWSPETKILSWDIRGKDEFGLPDKILVLGVHTNVEYSLIHRLEYKGMGYFEPTYKSMWKDDKRFGHIIPYTTLNVFY